MGRVLGEAARRPPRTLDRPGDSPSFLSSPTQAGWELSRKMLATHSGPACPLGTPSRAMAQGTGFCRSQGDPGPRRTAAAAAGGQATSGGGGTYVQTEFKDKRRKMT